MPLASLPITLAVAGATMRRSISVASAMCSMSALSPRANWSVMTGRRVIASKVSGWMNFRAPRVITAVTWCPRSCSRRATSTAL
jgi:hypothetical protein